MKNKDKKIKFNKDSIRMRLLVVPIIVVVISILLIALISTTSSKKALLDEMDSNGEFTLRTIVGRMNDNAHSLKVINDNI